MSGRPKPHAWLEVPQVVARAYTDWRWDLVWQTEGHAVVYRVSRSSGEAVFLKLAPADHYPSVIEEVERMQWAGRHLPVPRMIAHGSDAAVDWVATAPLKGLDGTDPRHSRDPQRLVRALAAGLRQFHDRAPVVDCPFDFRLDAALVHIRRRAGLGLIDAARDFKPEFQHLSVQDAVAILERTRPSSEDLVVCHGDCCPPNIIIDEWQATGFLDLGELGVADRWWDLATATWSLTWNLGPGYEELFLSEYGVSLDVDRCTYYRLMYDLAS